MDNNQKINEIKSYMEDARYSIIEKPYLNIFKIISIWIISLFMSDVILNIITDISINLNWIETNWYFQLYNYLQLFLYLSTILIYFLSIYKINLRYREKVFLKTWSFIPIFIIFSKLLPLIIQYINAYFLLNFYNILTIHSVVFLAGLFLIYSYRKNKIYIIEIVLNTIVIILNLILTVYMYNNGFSELNLIIKIDHFIYFINNFDIYILSLLLFMYLDYKNVQKF